MPTVQPAGGTANKAGVLALMPPVLAVPHQYLLQKKLSPSIAIVTMEATALKGTKDRQ